LPPIKIIQIGGGEASAVEWYQGAQVGRNDRQYREYHPYGFIARVAKRVHYLEALGDFFAARLARSCLHFGAQYLGKLLELELREEHADGFSAHLGLEALGKLLAGFAILALGQQFLVLERGLADVGYH